MLSKMENWFRYEKNEWPVMGMSINNCFRELLQRKFIRKLTEIEEKYRNEELSQDEFTVIITGLIKSYNEQETELITKNPLEVVKYYEDEYDKLIATRIELNR